MILLLYNHSILFFYVIIITYFYLNINLFQDKLNFIFKLKIEFYFNITLNMNFQGFKFFDKIDLFSILI